MIYEVEIAELISKQRILDLATYQGVFKYASCLHLDDIQQRYIQAVHNTISELERLRQAKEKELNRVQRALLLCNL